PLERLERQLSPLLRVEGSEGAVLRQAVEQGQNRGHHVLEGAVQHEHLARHLLADGPRVVARLDAEVPAEEVEDWEVRRGLAVRERGPREHGPAMGPMRADEFVEEARLPHAWLADHRHDLARPLARLLETGAELLQLDVAADEACEPSRGRGLKPRAG